MTALVPAGFIGHGSLLADDRVRAIHAMPLRPIFHDLLPSGEDSEAVEARAEADHTTTSEVIREALRRFLDVADRTPTVRVLE